MKVLGALSLVLAVIIGWIFWMPIRLWAFSQLPHNEWVGLLKIILTIIIAYFGGIGIPLIFIFLGVGMILKS